jgi:hypothetical protein
MTTPNFIGIGAQKAGTTWLYDMLAQNPSVWLPPLKEVHFFDSLDADSERKRKRSEHILKVARNVESGRREKGSGDSGADKGAFLRTLAGDHIMTEAWYRSIFAHPDAEGRVSGEITPAYLALEEKAVRKVAEMLPDTKFVLVVREPMSRNLSQIKMAVARSKSEPTEADWDVFLAKVKRTARGDYASAIPLWQKYFGPDRLLILPFALVRKDPAGMLRQIEDFIGAERFEGYKALTEQVHKTKEVAVPDRVSRELEELARPQRQYLIEAFGQDFYENTR